MNVKISHSNFSINLRAQDGVAKSACRGHGLNMRVLQQVAFELFLASAARIAANVILCLPAATRHVGFSAGYARPERIGPHGTAMSAMSVVCRLRIRRVSRARRLTRFGLGFDPSHSFPDLNAAVATIQKLAANGVKSSMEPLFGRVRSHANHDAFHRVKYGKPACPPNLTR